MRYMIPRWLGSVTVRTLDLRSRDRWFDSRLGHYQVVSTWMGDCLQTGKPSQDHRPTRGSATGVSQSLDHGSGTVCQPGFASLTTTLENFVGS